MDMEEISTYRIIRALETASKAYKLLPELPDGLKPPHFRSLIALDGILAERGSCRISDIADRLSMRLPNATKTVGELEEFGLVEKIPDGEDRRVVHVVPTARGAAYIEECVVDLHRALSSALADIDPAECEAAIATIDKLYSAMQKVYRSIGQP